MRQLSCAKTPSRKTKDAAYRLAVCLASHRSQLLRGTRNLKLGMTDVAPVHLPNEEVWGCAKQNGPSASKQSPDAR
jgi:hypothetical protein